MPTPTGMLKVGELVEVYDHNGTPIEARVVRREGTTNDYHVWLERTDGTRWTSGNTHAGGMQKILLNVPFQKRYDNVRFL